MKLSRAVEQVRQRGLRGGLRKLATELLEELRGGSSESLRAGITRVASAFEGEHKASASPDGKTVFNIAIAVAVGVPVSKREGDAGDGKAQEPDDSGGQGAGAPAVATASVSPEPVASVPKAALEAERSEPAPAESPAPKRAPKRKRR